MISRGPGLSIKDSPLKERKVKYKIGKRIYEINHFETEVSIKNKVSNIKKLNKKRQLATE